MGQRKGQNYSHKCRRQELIVAAIFLHLDNILIKSTLRNNLFFSEISSFETYSIELWCTLFLFSDDFLVNTGSVKIPQLTHPLTFLYVGNSTCYSSFNILKGSSLNHFKKFLFIPPIVFPFKEFFALFKIT